ncbi:MAG: GNAT family N-acetyltransferase [Bythopirellula sp.]|nr:GNAT family N-acetyltransferase [Bythopirellula sp.]
MSIHIRPATSADAELVFGLICKLAVYEKLRHEVVATVETICETIFGPDSCTEVLIAEWNGEPAGFAIFFATYSTFLGRQGIYLEDIYVREELRGHGIGKRLLAEVARVAVDRQCGRLEWSVLDWNKPAIDFYESLGAEAQSEWIRYRMTGEALQALAHQAHL